MADPRPNGYEASELDRKKAKAFFDRGNTVAGTGNYDYAIEMYVNGLPFDPDNQDVHQTLRDISLRRKATGGKAKGFMEAMKLKRPSKDDKQNLINNEELLAFDPGNTDYMVGVLQNALRGGFYRTVMWMGPILLKANADNPKTSEFNKFIVVRDAYKVLEEWKLAEEACHYAVLLRPEDMDLKNELRHLGAQETINKGKYDKKEGNFTQSIKGREEQELEMQRQKDINSLDQMAGLIKKAEEEYKANPNDAGKIAAYADTLAKTELTEYENKAIDVLQGAFEKFKSFRFRQRIGVIRMAQLSRMERSLRQAVQTNPNDAEAKQNYSQFRIEKLQEELAEYRLVAENYPTDATAKYNVAIRLVGLKTYDEAIPVLQQLRNDPKYKTDAGNLLGQAFLEAGYTDESVDTYAHILTDYPTKGDKRSIEMTYVYGRGLEMKKELQSALKAYSQVAQWDFQFRDVQNRIKKLRGDLQNPQ